jgi:hypothetical protein
LVLLATPGFFYAHDLAMGLARPYEPRLDPHPEFPELGVEWRMHPVDNPGDWLANGLDRADVDGDGREDFLTNYEFDGRIRIALHPGGRPGEEPWTAVDVGRHSNAESSALGDLDADGAVDVVVVHGVEHADQPPAARILWGSPAQALRWTDSGPIPSSLGGWHFLFVRALDLDRDGDLDLVAGGRAARLAAEGQRETRGEKLNFAGIRWFANPLAGGGDPRDLAGWTVHAIDAGTQSGHGFEAADLDLDGDLDLVNANADWDTPQAEENVAWYENPGPQAVTWPWRIHELYRSSEFYGKEQVAVADLDRDGRLDVAAHAPNAIYLFRDAGRSGQTRREVIEKHPAARWRARPLEIADLNGDGRPDLIGALIHQQGRLPRNRAAVFWMEQTDSGWRTHVIKWGDGFFGLGTFNGEKWDQIIPCDVDGDGDLDLMANVEEYNRLRSILSVVWFENPTVS